ncbi:claudin-like in caenorhabditis [Anaeramoeba ignava]|uniref:Claudin-like in caenorhabditis n=1 Tax=Anaeramoeba ignava TaxID=1746090 RepID=A0A9Q0LT13_ANAIG|nr:claudin-like in caenorhabditis [Anaeramoeba ignava]
MGVKIKNCILFIFPIAAAILSIFLLNWRFGTAKAETLIGEKTDVDVYLGSFQMKTSGKVNDSNEDETYKLSDMKDNANVTSTFSGDWDKLYKNGYYITIGFAIGIILSILCILIKAFMKFLGWVPAVIYTLGILLYYFKNPNVDDMLFNSPDAFWPLYNNGTLSDAKIMSLSYSFGLAICAAVLSLIFWIIALKFLKKDKEKRELY